MTSRTPDDSTPDNSGAAASSTATSGTAASGKAAPADSPPGPRLPRNLRGQVQDSLGQPVVGTQILFFQEGGASADTRTDGEGLFIFDLSDTTAWPQGRYSLRVVPTGNTLLEDERLNLPANGSPAPLKIRVHRTAEISQGKGWSFFVTLCVLLIVLVGSYLNLHGVSISNMQYQLEVGDGSVSSISAPLAASLDTVHDRVTKAEKLVAQTAAGGAAVPHPAGPGAPAQSAAASDAPTGEGRGTPEQPFALDPVPVEPAGTPPATLPSTGSVANPPAAGAGGNPGRQLRQQALDTTQVSAAMDTAMDIWKSHQADPDRPLNSDLVTAIDGLFAQAQVALTDDDLPALADDINRLLSLVEDRDFLWNSQHGRLLEVFCWALFSTLLRLIFNSAFYLYKNTFIATAIPHHVALIVTIPVIAVIIAMVLSLVTLEFAIAETAIALDMSNPMISVLVACLIGLAPWKAWEFVRRLADRLFDALAGLFKKT